MSTHPVRWVGECERCGELLNEHDTQDAAERDAENCPCRSAGEPPAGESVSLKLTSRERGMLAEIRAGGGMGRSVWSAGFDELRTLERAGLVTVEWDDTGPVLTYPTKRAES